MNSKAENTLRCCQGQSFSHIAKCHDPYFFTKYKLEAKKRNLRD